MSREGLTKERITKAAAELIEQRGADNFSMRALADSLGIKAASLYNHVDGMDALVSEVCSYALSMQRDIEMSAIKDKRGKEAVFALAYAYRKFAREHWQLYRVIMNTAACAEGDISRCVIEPFLAVLSQTGLAPDEMIHWQRVLRGIVHGFVSQEASGFFAHLSADPEESFKTAVQCYTDGLECAERRNGYAFANE